jgi:hypothetical protein
MNGTGLRGKCANCGRKETRRWRLIWEQGDWWCPGACLWPFPTNKERPDGTD